MSTLEWKTISSRSVHSWHGMKLCTDDVELPDGTELEYTYIKHPGSVVIVPFLGGSKRVVLIEQYRYTIRSLSLEVPAGYLGAGESPEEAARRELREETGLAAEDLRELGVFYPTNGSSDERTVVYWARASEGGSQRREQGEVGMRIRVLSFDEVVAATRDGRITDGFTIVAVLLAAEKGVAR